MDWGIPVASLLGFLLGLGSFFIATKTVFGGIVSFLACSAVVWFALGQYFTDPQLIVLWVVGLVVFFGLGFATNS
ncbi:hypothetical protein [Pedococcus sp. 5OH_020]|uniref:hypothetical protein n=1 Tax=Pedococcus sp. 5OH_020 TaxID=2989814 RepID=UPI0022E99F8B|nr:hypothetical protein [Pedococcus sp. 5OH_020]